MDSDRANFNRLGCTRPSMAGQSKLVANFKHKKCCGNFYIYFEYALPPPYASENVKYRSGKFGLPVYAKPTSKKQP